MRERTPSADDTPKRAPPAPPREAASADVLVDGRSARVVLTDSTRTSNSVLSSSTERRIRTMVASTRGLDDLASSQSTINDRPQQQNLQQQQQHNSQHNHYHLNQYNHQQQQNHLHNNHPQDKPLIGGYRQAQTAQDKRSRLSNVINNLRKKVPTDTTSVHDSRRTKESSHERELNNHHHHHQKREDEDDSRNSVERNLANLEKYVMTVLNGVIKDAESKDEVKTDAERTKTSTELSNDAQNPIGSGSIEILSRKEDETDDPHAGSTEPSKPNESRLEAAVPLQPEATANKTEVDDKASTKKDDNSENIDLSNDISRIPSLEKDETQQKLLLEETQATELNSVVAKKSNDPPELQIESQNHTDNDVDRLSNDVAESRLSIDTLHMQVNELPKVEKRENDAFNESQLSSAHKLEISEKDNDCKNSSAPENTEIVKDSCKISANDNTKMNNRSLSTIILDRLTDHQASNAGEISQLPNDSNPLSDTLDNNSENEELRLICRDLLNELLNDISQLIEETPVDEDLVIPAKEIILEDVKDQSSPDLANTSIQCSLPLEKVAAVLQNCQNSQDTSQVSSSAETQQTSKPAAKLPSPTIRHLCLYCDRKFLSISLRQRHTERVHQLGGGRRSERNSRKTTQNCQYCSDKCADSLDALFNHMIGKHADKYHACVQCTTRYSTKDVLVNHMSDFHGFSNDKISERQDKAKENCAFKETAISRDISSHSLKDKTDTVANSERRLEEDHEQRGNETITSPAKPSVTQSMVKDVISNPGSPEFDSSFYSSVSCNIRDNLLHHLDGKLQTGSSSIVVACNETKSQLQSQQQTFYEHGSGQIQFPIDISLTAATPVYNKEYGASDEYENSSEYAQKPGKTGRSHPRRVSFEKYNFPRKYEGKEQWSCSIKDLSKFDISTQLSLRKKQQIIKERLKIGRLHDTTVLDSTDVTDFGQTEIDNSENESENVCRNLEIFEDSGIDNAVEKSATGFSGRNSGLDQLMSKSEVNNDEHDIEESATDAESSQDSQSSNATIFTAEFGSFIKLQLREERKNSEAGSSEKIVYAELTGEWSRPRIYICGACASRHVTLREMEEHKASSHPNVWCSHLEFTGDQRELYKHLFLPGRCLATTRAKNAVLAEKVCTKCSKVCGSLAELHRHMLECGGDQAWLLGLFGNGKKKCKWRPFGSRSRRRRQRGMKRNIQNSQTPRVNQPRERNSSGPRVRPSDRESIQKMLANLPPKRASRRVMQETTVRTQGRLRKMQTRSRPRLVEPTPSNSRLSRKAVLRNKLLKHAKSFQRKICRGDNITAAIESVVKKNDAEEEVDDESGEEEEEEEEEEEDDVEDDSGRVFKESIKFESTKSRGETAKGRWNLESSNRSTKIVRGVRVVSKKRNVKSKEAHKTTGVKVKNRVITNRRTVVNATPNNSKNGKNSSKNKDKTAANSANDNQTDSKSQSSNSSTPSHSAILRRKKHVDPVVSLHASLKARNQLRTHDGKFARTSDVRDMRSTSCASEEKSLAITASQNIRTRARRHDASRLVTRAKLRAARRTSNDAKVTRRTYVKRISLDSDKMPTLEAANEKIINEEKSTGKSVSELPILTPIASIIGKTEQKNSRTSSRSSSTTKVNSANHQQVKNPTEIDLDEAIEKNVIDVTQIKNSVENTNEEQRPTRARRKKIVRDVKKSEEAETTTKDESTRVADSARDFRAKNRTSLPARPSSSTDYSEESSRRRCSSKESKTRELEDVEIVKKSSKPELISPARKIEPSKPVDSRQARQERRAGSLEDFSKLQDVPDEVKKLLGPSDDLFAQIGLKKREKTKKNPRQPLKTKANTPKQRVHKKNPNTDESKPGESAQETDKEKIGLRKSPRYAEKKDSASTITKSTAEVAIVDESIQVLVTETSNDKIEIDIKTEAAKIENNPSDELEDNPKVNNSLGKRRGRIKSHVEEENAQSSSQSQLNVGIEKEDASEKEEDESKDTVTLTEETTENLETIENKSEDVPKDLSTDIATLSFEHLQQESNNSNIDSGKENSSETPVNVSKLKVVRPKKSRGLRRDRMAKRTLNNVIGILTEGVNIPVEVQQSVVLTVQTSIEGVTPETAVQSNPSQIADNNVAAGEVSNIRASVKPNESSDAACSSSATVDEEGENVTQFSPQIESETIEQSKENCSLAEKIDTDVQIQCYNLTEVIPATPISAKLLDNVQHAAIDQPTNDIILDLSRRKPKGKGSFLEKIVSKIAKQKDAQLESEVGCHLESSAGDIKKIVDQVDEVKILNEKPEILKGEDKNSMNLEKVVIETNILPDTKQSKDDAIVVPLVINSEKEVQINQNVDDVVLVESMGRIDETKNQGETQVQPTEEQTLGSEIIPTSSQEFSATPESTVVPIDDEDVANFEPKRTSKKRSLDAVTPKKNKRKTVETNEGEKDSSEDEICLADIMKLINSSKQSTSKTDEKSEAKVRPGKRKTMEQDKDENLSTIADYDGETVVVSNDKKKLQTQVTEVNKKSKRNNAKKSQICNEATDETISDKIKPADEIQQEKVTKDSELETELLKNIDQNSAEDLATPSSIIEVKTDAEVEVMEKPLIETEKEIEVEQTSAIPKPFDSVEDNSLKIVKQSQLIFPEDTVKSKTARKRAAKKKSLADEHLDLPDDEPTEKIGRQQKEVLTAPAIIETTPALNLNSSSEVVSSAVLAESFKVPESNEFLETTKRRKSKKKSLAAEHLELLDDAIHSLPQNILPSEPVDDVTDFMTLPAGIIKNDEKTKNQIDIVEEKSISASKSTTKMDGEEGIEAPSISDDSIVSENSEIKTSTKNESVVNAEEETDASITDCESLDAEGDTPEARRNLTKKSKDNAPETDELGPLFDPKLQRKFAVVHTKSGKMLIVEKKKKFTKEAAKFFCEVCAASFTRKSSLKKHNSSQFHLLQLSKCGDENERDTTTLDEDATTSSIDVSNDVSNSVEFTEEAKQLSAIKDDATKTVENTEIPTVEKIIAENILDKVHQTDEPEKCDISTVNLPDESAFENPDIIPEEDLEDELLDEEICKITENMTHDEYVLTDHVSPVLPEAASTPVNFPDKTNEPEIVEKVKENKELNKKEKNKAKQLEKKRNLADEHLDLDSPVPSDILADITVSSILEEGTEKSLDIIPILDIPELSKSSSDLTIITAMDKQMNDEISESCQSIPISALVDVSKSILEEENVISEKSLRSKRKNSKISASKVENKSKNEILTEEPKDSLLGDIDVSNVSVIEEKSIVQPEEVKDVIIENANDEPILEFLPKTSNDFKEPFKVNSTMTLDFSNITEKLKAQESSTKDTSRTTEFDSSEDSLDTNMSDDIRKILNDPELDADNKQVTQIQSKNEGLENPQPSKTQTSVKQVDTLPTETLVTSAKKTKQQKTKPAEINDAKLISGKNAKQNVEENQKIPTPKINEKKSTRNKSSVKEPAKKIRTTKPKKNNNSMKNKTATETSDSEYDEKKDGTESQNKSKIVKCVFGRVFGGEKADKVKEVLDDWVSRSEGDSHEDSQTTVDSSTAETFDVPIVSPLAVEAKRSRKNDDKSTKRHSRNASQSKSPSSGRTRSRNRKQARSKKETKEEHLDCEDPNPEESITERRSRSKNGPHTRKRNTEKKSDSIAVAKPSEQIELTPNSRSRQSKIRAKEQITRFIEDDVEFDALISELKPGSKNKKETREGKQAREEELKGKKLTTTPAKNKKRDAEEDPEEDEEASEEEITTILTSKNNPTSTSKRERSTSPDDNSQKTLVSMNVDEISNSVDAEEEDENEIALGRLSPLYVCNSPASSMESDTNSDDEENDSELRENRTRVRNTGEFTGEKVVIRSPPSALSNREDRTEVVTIAPTDAIEDNALDVPREIDTSPGQKPRQGKVLNFDEELFVECCSRLKATTENELRGAKKIKLDHTEAYNKNEDPATGFRVNRDRWRDVESQNSLGSLLESVNQLLGEEMYTGSRTNDYPKRGRNVGSERSSRTASPEVDANRQETLGYEDSLDVAFEHNNKLRVKIQQRMRESENLIASTFGQKTSGSLHRHHHHHHHRQPNHQRRHENQHQHHHRRDNRPIDHGRKDHVNEADRLNDVNQSVHKGEHYADLQDEDKSNDRSQSAIDQSAKHVDLDCSNFRSKNPALGGLLDKALSNLLHSNGKHDHNGSTPMNVLAELACARVPTATIPEVNSPRDKSSANSPTRARDSSTEEHNRAIVNTKDAAPKKSRNPIKELFERKKVINERKQHHQEKSEADVALREFNVQRQKKSKKPKRQQQQQQQQHQQGFPLIRKGQLGGMVERKKRRDGAERKAVHEDAAQERIKDIYDFDDEESQTETAPVLSYRMKNDKNYEVMSCLKTKKFDMTDLMTKTIGETLKNGKPGDALGKRLESMINRKFQEIETFAPKTKGALKSFHMEEKQQQQQEQKQQLQQVTGPMDDFVERKQRSKKFNEPPTGKHGRSKRRSKNSKKKSRNAWYENDSSDEFRTAAKAEDVGVGITKSQRTCSKGKQNLFAELSTSSESEYEDDEGNYEAKRRLARLNQKKIIEEQRQKEHHARISPELADNYPQEQEDHEIVDWLDVTAKTDSKIDLEHKKSESEMSDHPLVIDERKTETDEPRNSDDDTETRYNPTFELDDLYREDSSVADSDPEEESKIENEEVPEESRTQKDEEVLINDKSMYSEEKELIPLEEALNLLDNNEDLVNIPERLNAVAKSVETLENQEEFATIDEKISDRDDDDKTSDQDYDDKTSNRDYDDKTSNRDEDEVENEDIDNEAAEAAMPEELEEELPEKLSSNEKPPKESENLPLHVFLSRKVQESKKRKQQQQKKLQEEQEKILLEFAPTRRQRKCAIGKQGLLAEISSSDDESYTKETCRRSVTDKSDHERQSRKPKRESKEKRKERYMEKKHEQIIAKEQKAIEEEILRELEKTKGNSTKCDSDSGKSDVNNYKKNSTLSDKSEPEENPTPRDNANAAKKKRQQKSKKSKNDTLENKISDTNDQTPKKSNAERKSNSDETFGNETQQESSSKPKRQSKSSQRVKKSAKTPEIKVTNANRKSKLSNSEKNKPKPTSTINKEPKERRGSSAKRDSDDEELRTTKCWNKVDEGVGVAIGRRKRAAANQLYYWSSSSDDDEPIPASTAVVEEEDDRQEQHGWIVGDSHKRMITMLAMEKQLKEKRRRSEDEFEPGKTKNKKHRNSTS